MTSTFSSSHNFHIQKNNRSISPRHIEAKKETLLELENALKKRISELRELCLKEGELTGHLPIDYPLQPREPIPQVRSRNHSVNNNINNNNKIRNHSVENSMAQLISLKAHQRIANPNVMGQHGNGMTASVYQKNPSMQQVNYPPRQQTLTSIQSTPATIVTHPQANNTAQIYFPSRPTSTNSTSSSNSTASSNTRSLSNTSAPHYFQPYYEETKPFQMSDFYKYSSKHRTQSSRVNEVSPVFKTTRQLQEDVLKKNSLKYNACDDQIQASVKLIEKSGQKLIEATAKAIASNPSLAEKINNIMPNKNGDRY